MNQKMNKKRHIFLAGGQTAGPIVPLLAVAKVLRDLDNNIEPVVIDVKHGMGTIFANKENYISKNIITGKLRRYFSLQTFLSPVLFVIGFFQSLSWIFSYKPILILGAGGYAQVPLMWAAWILRKPVMIHQQDLVPSLSNILCMTIAKLITVSFENSTSDFLQGSGIGNKYLKDNKVFWTGNPRLNTKVKLSKEEIKTNFNLLDSKPVVLVNGGSSGAMGLNVLVWQNLEKLLKFCQIIHIAGKGKLNPEVKFANYYQCEFLEEINEAYIVSDLIISRAGINNITDLATYKKPAIILPMPQSHQEQNAELLYKQEAAYIADQSEVDLPKEVHNLLLSSDRQNKYINNISKLIPSDADQKIVKLIVEKIFNGKF